MNSQRHWEDYLEDILDAVESIEEILNNIGA
jgi:uncharacterized protein with HEPN domain